jgi:hypothetical protein
VPADFLNTLGGVGIPGIDRYGGFQQSVSDFQPLPEQPLDLLLSRCIAHLLELFRLGTGMKTVERLVTDPALVQLPFGPLMAVDAQLDSPRRVAADFDKQRSEVLVVNVVNVEVVVIRTSRCRRNSLARSSFRSLYRN